MTMLGGKLCEVRGCKSDAVTRRDGFYLCAEHYINDVEDNNYDD